MNDDSKEQARVCTSPEQRLEDYIEIFNTHTDGLLQACRSKNNKGVLIWNESVAQSLTMIERLEERAKNLKGTEDKPQRIEIGFAQAEPTIEALRQWAEKLGVEIKEK